MRGDKSSKARVRVSHPSAHARLSSATRVSLNIQQAQHRRPRCSTSSRHHNNLQHDTVPDPPEHQHIDDFLYQPENNDELTINDHDAPILEQRAPIIEHQVPPKDDKKPVSTTILCRVG